MIHAKVKTPRQWWVLMLTTALAFVMFAASAKTAAAADMPAAERGSTVSMNQDGHGGDQPEFYGIVAQMPEGGREGLWIIGTKEVTATSSTEFDELEGPLAVGVCAKVRLTAPGSNIADEIERENPSDCDGGHDGGDDDSGDGISGIVESMPVSGTVGAWVISSKSYTVTEQTILETKYGAFDVGRCVEVYLVTGTTDIARKLETKPAFKCDRDDDDDDNSGGNNPPAGTIGRGEVYGELFSFPAELVGLWNVGTLTFTADANTEFKTRGAAFEVGQVVKVEFYIMQDGTFLAREIKTAMSDDDDDDDHGGHHGRHEAHAFGTIEQLPESGLTGLWIVSGVQYSVTEQTRLHDRNGTFAISETVKIEFRIDGSGMRVAKEIKLIGPRGVPGEDATVVGFVESMPENGYIGLWVVNGIEFTGTVSSKFKDKHGAFTVGSYVKVEYRTVNGERIIHEMESEVPPGGGDDDYMGRIERMDDNSATAAAATVDSTWTIGGRAFVVTPATRASGSLTTSDTVLVNSYQAADGTQVATLISGVTLTDFLYLPSLTR